MSITGQGARQLCILRLALQCTSRGDGRSISELSLSALQQPLRFLTCLLSWFYLGTSITDRKKKKFDLETWNSIFYIQRYSQRTNFRIVQCKLKEPQRKYTQCILVMVRLVAFFISFVLVFHFRAAFSNHHEGVCARAINLLSHSHCNIQMKIVGGIFFSILQRYIAECRALNLVKASIRASWPWSDTRGARLNYSWNLFFYSKVKSE